jgi:hypothetical protein
MVPPEIQTKTKRSAAKRAAIAAPNLILRQARDLSHCAGLWWKGLRANEVGDDEKTAL